MSTRARHLTLIQGGKESSTVTDKLRGNYDTCQKVGGAIARLLGQLRPQEIKASPVIFRNFDSESGIIMPQTHPSGGKIMLADEKFIGWLWDKGVNQTTAIDYTMHYITALMHIDEALERNQQHVSTISSMGYQRELWDSAHSSFQRALSWRAAATVAMTATMDISSEIIQHELIHQPPHVAAIMNPIEEHRYIQLRSVLQ